MEMKFRSINQNDFKGEKDAKIEDFLTFKNFSWEKYLK